jgi:hypothetical protein
MGDQAAKLPMSSTGGVVVSILGNLKSEIFSIPPSQFSEFQSIKLGVT